MDVWVRGPAARMAATVVAAASAVALLGAPPAGAAHSEACPAGVPDAGFTDTDGSVHEHAIDCAVWWEVARGVTASSYRPAGTVTRAQMASFIARTIREAGGTLPEPSRDHFEDDDGSVHEPAINTLAEAGVVAGRGDGRYAPSRDVTRAQMATYLVRAYGVVAGSQPTADRDYFDDDDGDPHEANINAAAAAGFTSGISERSYGPAQAVRRDQVASFLTAVLAALIAEGHTEARQPPSSSGSRSVPSAPSVAYQINPQHSGSQGVDTDEAVTLERAWSTSLGGPTSYAVIAEAMVFVTVADPGAHGYGTTLHALDAETGQKRWQIELGGTYYWSALAYEDGRLFALNYSGILRAFAPADGRQLWAVDLPEQGSFSSAPTAVGGQVYAIGAGLGGTTYAVDAASGEVWWTTDTFSGGSHSSPTVADGRVMASFACNQAYAWDAASGTELWHHRTGCTGGGGKNTAVHRRRLYTRDSGGNLILDAATGEQVGAHSGRFIPAFLDDHGYFTERTGALAAWRVDTMTPDWRFEPPSAITTAPIVVSGTVFVATEDGTLYGLDGETGDVTTQLAVGESVPPPDEHNVSSPLTGLTAGGGLVVVPTADGVTAFR